MTPDSIPWIIAIASAALLAAAVTLWALRQRRAEPPPLPQDWALTARPVFSSDERRVYRQLREALPHHVVLSKLPLVRFCQPTDPQQVRYWYELLGSAHVGFAICSANGRVLAAIDIDPNDRGNARRALLVKQKVLAACRVRYLRCPVDHLPSVPELQLLVPQLLPATRAPQAAPAAASIQAPRGRRRSQRPLWQDSGFFQDSFFSADSRLGSESTSGTSEFGSLMRSPRETAGSTTADPPDAVAGVVVGAAPPLRH
jgi:Protein of unknown function (DUF2726)